MEKEIYKLGDRVKLITGIKGTVIIENGELVVDKDWNATGEQIASLSSIKSKINRS